MSKSKSSKIIDYPKDEVFSGFIKLTKREFPKLKENNPIGCKNTRRIQQGKRKPLVMRMEVIDFEKENMYKVKNDIEGDLYYNTYIFEEISETSTRFTLIEEQVPKLAISKVVVAIQGVVSKGRFNGKVARMVDGIVSEVELRRKNIDKNAKKKK